MRIDEGSEPAHFLNMMENTMVVLKGGLVPGKGQERDTDGVMLFQVQTPTLNHTQLSSVTGVGQCVSSSITRPKFGNEICQALIFCLKNLATPLQMHWCITDVTKCRLPSAQ